MEPIKIPVIWDDSQFKGGIRESMQDVQKMRDETDQLGKKTSDTNKQMGESLNKTNRFLSDQKDILKKTKDEGVKYSDALEKAADNINIMGVNLGGAVRNLKAKQSALKGLVTGLGGTTRGLKALRVALVSTGIGAIVVLLGSLVSWLTKTQEGIDKVNQVLSGLSAAFNVIIDRGAKIGGLLVDLFTGQKKLSEAWTEGKGALSGMVDEMVREGREAASLTAQLQDLKRAEDELTIKRAESRAEIKRLNKISEDNTKSIKERSDAAKKAIAIELDLAAERKRLLEQQLAAQKALDDQGNSTDADLAEQRRIRTEIANVAEESYELQTTLQSRLNGLQNEYTAKIAEQAAKTSELKDKYTELFESLTDQLLEIDESTLSSQDRLLMQQEAALGLLRMQREELIKTAEQLGKPVDEINRQFDKLENSVINTTQARIRATAELEGLDVTTDLDSIQISDGLQRELDNRPLKAPQTVKVEVESVDVVGDFKKSILSSLGLSEEEGQQILGSIQSTLQSAEAIYRQSIQNRITALDEEIAKRQENRERLEEEIAFQEELEREGFANSAEAAREALASEIEQEEAAIEQRDKLRKKEQRLQAITQIAQQAGSLITAGAQIFAAESGKGAVGVALAIAAIAAMAASFAKLKSDAKKATKLFTGTDRIGDHFMSVGPKSDKTSAGYAVVDAETGYPTGVVIGGDEPLMRSELSEHRAFFRDMNMHPEKYRGKDLISMFGGYRKANNNFIAPMRSAGRLHPDDMAMIMEGLETEHVVIQKDGKTYIRKMRKGQYAGHTEIE